MTVCHGLLLQHVNCGVKILPLRFLSHTQYFSLTCQPNPICFNFNNTGIVKANKICLGCSSQYVTGNLGWGVMLEKCRSLSMVTKVWNRTISYTCSYLFFCRGRRKCTIFNRTKLCVFFGGTWLYYAGAFMFAKTVLRWLKAFVCLFFFCVRILASLALRVVHGQYRT